MHYSFEYLLNQAKKNNAITDVRPYNLQRCKICFDNAFPVTCGSRTSVEVPQEIKFKWFDPGYCFNCIG